MGGQVKPDQDKSLLAGHRERLRQKFLDNKLTDYELLELLLGYVIPRCDVKPLARSLLQKYGGIYSDYVTGFADSKFWFGAKHCCVYQGYL